MLTHIPRCSETLYVCERRRGRPRQFHATAVSHTMRVIGLKATQLGLDRRHQCSASGPGPAAPNSELKLRAER
ncbi:hypothetical protein GN956_G13432 [Arapaima gigas]